MKEELRQLLRRGAPPGSPINPGREYLQARLVELRMYSRVIQVIRIAKGCQCTGNS